MLYLPKVGSFTGRSVLAALSGFVSPAFQSIMTSQVPANAQGELQGALSSLNSVTSIVGPLLMTKLFSTYTVSMPAIIYPVRLFLSLRC